jgi:hypothetical protein
MAGLGDDDGLVETECQKLDFIGAMGMDVSFSALGLMPGFSPTLDHGLCHEAPSTPIKRDDDEFSTAQENDPRVWLRNNTVLLNHPLPTCPPALVCEHGQGFKKWGPNRFVILFPVSMRGGLVIGEHLMESVVPDGDSVASVAKQMVPTVELFQDYCAPPHKYAGCSVDEHKHLVSAVVYEGPIFDHHNCAQSWKHVTCIAYQSPDKGTMSVNDVKSMYPQFHSVLETLETFFS